MVKHNQTIRRQKPKSTNCLSVFDSFVGLAFKGLRVALYTENENCNFRL